MMRKTSAVEFAYPSRRSDCNRWRYCLTTILGLATTSRLRLNGRQFLDSLTSHFYICTGSHYIAVKIWFSVDISTIHECSSLQAESLDRSSSRSRRNVWNCVSRIFLPLSTIFCLQGLIGDWYSWRSSVEKLWLRGLFISLSVFPTSDWVLESGRLFCRPFISFSSVCYE